MGFTRAPQAPAGRRPAMETSSHTTFLFLSQFLMFHPLTTMHSLDKLRENFRDHRQTFSTTSSKLSSSTSSYRHLRESRKTESTSSSRHHRQTFIIIDIIFSTSSPKLSSSSRQLRENFHHLLDNFVKTFIIFSTSSPKLSSSSRQLRENFHHHQQHLLDIINIIFVIIINKLSSSSS